MKDAKKLRNIFVIFVVSGFWHGANWTFIVWGALNALFFLPLIFLNKNRVHLNVVAEKSYLPTLKEISQILFTFTITTFAWIFFRAENIQHAIHYISTIFSTSLFKIPEFNFLEIAVLLIFFLVIEWIGRREQYAIEKCLMKINYSLRWLFYLALLVMIFTFGKDANEFIYFQF